MLTLFLNLKDAEDLCNKIHKHLQENCPNYSAACWQLPTKSDKSETWYVQLPVEYYKEFYSSVEKIDVVCLAEKAKASQEVEKLPDSFFNITAPLSESEPLPK